MAIPRLSPIRLAVAAIAVVILGIAISAVQANPTPSASAPASAPGHNGTNINQGIAYSLIVLALVLTYLIHSADIPHL